jgi:tRNA(Ile)-lysidine synthase
MIAEAVRQFFINFSLAPCRICVAVSGGVDSTALLLLLADLRQNGFEVVAGHVNHHLRGAESDADEAFVRDLCAELGVSLHVADGTLGDDRVRDRGVEAAARDVRYERLQSIRARSGARYLATAHQKDDQAETVLMRLLTGSGIAGLRGIHPIRDDGVIRPLLEVTRADIESFLASRNVTPRFDRSNEDPRFLRNRVRVLVRELGAIDNLAHVAAQARAQWPILERAIDDAERAHAQVSDDETRFSTWPHDQWLRGALLQRHIRRLDPHARDFDAMRIAGELESIKRIRVTKNLELIRDDDALVLRRAESPSLQQASIAFEVPLTPHSPAIIRELGITMHVEQRATSNGQRIQLPPGANPTFTVRNRRPGDRFHPLGSAGSKTLKDFLIDRKIAAELRDCLPLLLWNGEIVWVAGVEVSERFKVSTLHGDLYDVWLEEAGAADSDHSRLQR